MGYDELLQPGDHQVRTTVVCVMTRFALRSALGMPFAYLDYRRVNKAATRVPGFLRSAFMIEDHRTCWSISIWRSTSDIPVFGTYVPEHVDVARRMFSRLRMDQSGRPELWSTKWHLSTVSNNLSWSESDFREIVWQQMSHS